MILLFLLNAMDPINNYCTHNDSSTKQHKAAAAAAAAAALVVSLVRCVAAAA
jgi:hypothetical protein